MSRTVLGGWDGHGAAPMRADGRRPVLLCLVMPPGVRPGLPPNQRTAPGRLVEGGLVNGWKQALGALVLHYPDRLAPYIN
jgi:hypothetical protein